MKHQKNNFQHVAIQFFYNIKRLVLEYTNTSLWGLCNILWGDSDNERVFLSLTDQYGPGTIIQLFLLKNFVALSYNRTWDIVDWRAVIKYQAQDLAGVHFGESNLGFYKVHGATDTT
jgi:hypothetical protein